MDNNMVSKSWVGITTTYIHLFHFKSQSRLQKRIKNTPTKLPSWVLWSRSTSVDETIRFASKLFILIQNLEFVNLKCIAYPQPIPLSLNLCVCNVCLSLVYFSVAIPEKKNRMQTISQLIWYFAGETDIGQIKRKSFCHQWWWPVSK